MKSSTRILLAIGLLLSGSKSLVQAELLGSRSLKSGKRSSSSDSSSKLKKSGGKKGSSSDSASSAPTNPPPPTLSPTFQPTGAPTTTRPTGSPNTAGPTTLSTKGKKGKRGESSSQMGKRSSSSEILQVDIFAPSGKKMGKKSSSSSEDETQSPTVTPPTVMPIASSSLKGKRGSSMSNKLKQIGKKSSSGSGDDTYAPAGGKKSGKKSPSTSDGGTASPTVLSTGFSSLKGKKSSSSGKKSSPSSDNDTSSPTTFSQKGKRVSGSGKRSSSGGKKGKRSSSSDTSEPTRVPSPTAAPIPNPPGAPTVTPVLQTPQPTIGPVPASPTQSPIAQTTQPTREPQADIPTGQPVTTVPTTGAPTGIDAGPSISPVTSTPTGTELTTEPTVVPTSRPSIALGTLSPTITLGSPPPTDVTGTGSPTIAPGSAPPTVLPGTGSPTIPPGSSPPTVLPGTGSPTTPENTVSLSRISIQYDLSSPDTPDDTQFAEAEGITISYIEDYFKNFFQFSDEVTLDRVIITPVTTSTDPVTIEYDTQMQFAPASDFIPSIQQLDGLMADAFKQPTVATLLILLGNLPAENPFSTTQNASHTMIVSGDQLSDSPGSGMPMLGIAAIAATISLLLGVTGVTALRWMRRSADLQYKQTATDDFLAIEDETCKSSTSPDHIGSVYPYGTSGFGEMEHNVRFSMSQDHMYDALFQQEENER